MKFASILYFPIYISDFSYKFVALFKSLVKIMRPWKMREKTIDHWTSNLFCKNGKLKLATLQAVETGIRISASRFSEFN